jgi:hypothetical protein
MTYAALPKLKKNSVPTTIASPGITNSATTIPVTELSRFYDEDGVLITEGIVLGFDSSTETQPEEITITGASGTSGAGNLTGVTRAVNLDGTIGVGYAWPEGTNVAVMFSTGIYKKLRANLAAIYAVAAKIPKELTILQATVPDTNAATWGQGPELSNGVNYPWASFNHTALQRVQWVIPMPSDWDGTLSSVVLGWSSISAGSGTVKWMVKGYRVADGGTLNATLAAFGNAIDTYQGASLLHTTTEINGITVSGTGTLLLLEVYRDYANDTLADDARLVTLEFYGGRTL